ncbi:MAG: hypothetical protein LUE91_03075 [Oscillospiraceae bacterium]|nr:hypothetical protein [Oscillospiraceae bacterium]
MADRVVPGPVSDTACIREAVYIHTKKIFDSCKDKDCVEDLRFYPTQQSQEVIDRAISVKAGRAELLNAYIDVEPVNFNRGFFTVDVRYFYRVSADVFTGASRPVEVCGLCVFDKRAILFGSDGSAKIFSSVAAEDSPDDQQPEKSNLPTAVVEAVDRIVLSARLVDGCGPRGAQDAELSEVPKQICDCFGGELSLGGQGRRVYISLGQFSMIRLERDTQLLMPAYDYCVPDKECSCGGEEDPCEVFRKVQFPMDEFFPPNSAAPCGDSQDCCQ